MVLGSKAANLTYPKSIYLSTSPFGFFYIEGSLAFPFSRWTEWDDQWMAGLFGLSWEKKEKPPGLNGEEAWMEYIDRVEGYLKKEIAVQTFWNWTPKSEEEHQDKIVTPAGDRAFWWEGMTPKTRPDTHSFVIVGLDRTNDLVRVNMPIAGWFGVEKYRVMKLSYLKKRIAPLRGDLKYKTIAYVPTGIPAKNESEIKQLVAERIFKKIQGDPAAFGNERNQRYLYGSKALEALKGDLNVSTFSQILDTRSRRQGFTPLEILVVMKLGFYQMQFITAQAAEYLEEQRMMPEWEWLSRLHLLYYELYISSLKLVDQTRTTADKAKYLEGIKPVLQEMQSTLDATVAHMKKYPTPQFLSQGK
ncbi:MAG: hypothetical protein JW943_11540 [Deltaproteobacteria bacterium]|nr:hypothetical protein [Deltaproteobacteria bacterium]